MFAGRLIRGVKNGPSPQWLQDRLRAIGLRPISALVDITNLVTFDRARPLHVFDADKLTGNVQARMARRGETLAALDNKTYTLDETICVIADDRRARHRGHHRRRGHRLHRRDGECLRRMRLVRARQPSPRPGASSASSPTRATASSARSIPERCHAGHRARGQADHRALRRHRARDSGRRPCARAGHGDRLPAAEVRRLTGLDASHEEIAGALNGSASASRARGAVRRVTVPSWRPDVTQKADLAEEAMRIIGVDKVPVEPLPRLSHVAPRMLTTIQNRRRLARRVLASRGLDEAVNWSFIPAAEAERFGGGAARAEARQPDRRRAHRHAALAAAGAARGRATQRQPRLRRPAAVRGRPSVPQAQPAGQHTHATALRAGTTGPSWREKGRPVDVFDVKADIGALLDALGHDIDKLQLVTEAPAWSHPGRGGRIQFGPKRTVAWFGEVHPSVLAAFDVEGPVVAFELDLDAMPEPRRKPTRAKPALALSDLMPVSRDFAFVVDREVTAATILKAARGADKALITDAAIFDVFEGAHIAEGKKSVAVAVTLQPQERTLTDEEIDKVSAAIVGSIEKATGGTLRT
jgi:phenylalanyl-tRNA synthetase beta chain